MSLIENMPDDLTLEILSRLPVKCLLRLKAVSKSWKDIMENSQFIAKHHHTRAAISNNGCILIKHLCYDSEEDRVFSFIYDDQLSAPSFKLKEYYSILFQNTEPERFINAAVAPCNGIFCVFLDLHNLVLWNPATREVKALPRSNLSDRLAPPPNFHWTKDCIGGLGFDPKSKAYKVVRIWVYLHNNNIQQNERRLDHNKFYGNIVEIWAPNNKCWRQINEVPPFPVIVDYEDQLNLNGRCYWRAGPFESILISFDMVKETFRGIPLPDAKSIPIKGETPYWHRTAILNESIALMSQPLQNEKCFEVWLMKEGYGDQITWSKHITISMPIPYLSPLGFWKNDELILQNGVTGNLVFLSTRTGELIDTEVRIDILQQVYVHNESLVSLKALD